MKKTFIALAMAALLAAAMPLMAIAAPSPQGKTLGPISGAKSTLTAIATNAEDITGTPYLVIEPAETPATTAALVTSAETIVDTYNAYMSDHASNISGPVTLVFNVGSEYANKTAHVYVVHDLTGSDPSASAAKAADTVVAADGTVSYTIDGLSYYTVTVEQNSQNAAADGSATSPQTGASPLTVVLVCAASLVVAGCVVAARKKVAE